MPSTLSRSSGFWNGRAWMMRLAVTSPELPPDLSRPVAVRSRSSRKGIPYQFRHLDTAPRMLIVLTYHRGTTPMKSQRNLTRFTYETTAFQGWRLCIARGGRTFTRYFSDKQCGGERKALKAAEAKLGELKAFLDSAPRKDGKLTTTAEAKARKVLKAGWRPVFPGVRPAVAFLERRPQDVLIDVNYSRPMPFVSWTVILEEFDRTYSLTREFTTQDLAPDIISALSVSRGAVNFEVRELHFRAFGVNLFRGKDPEGFVFVVADKHIGFPALYISPCPVAVGKVLLDSSWRQKEAAGQGH